MDNLSLKYIPSYFNGFLHSDVLFQILAEMALQFDDITTQRNSEREWITNLFDDFTPRIVEQLSPVICQVDI